jgi:putative ATPase
VFQFEPLAEADLLGVLLRALADRERGLGKVDTRCAPGALEYLAKVVEGDARRALGVLEVAVLSAKGEARVDIDEALLRESMQQKTIQYDRTGDEHYDVSSALIKSIRGSDPDAALYWLARMLEAGEDVRFICRRLVILASEDIGNADPQALQIAVAAMQACEFVGLPECQLTLSQAVIYLSLAEKSNAATKAIGLARKEVREGAAIPVPRHLRDGHYAGAAELGNATGYAYSHEADDGVADQDYLGVERHFLFPTDRGWEGGKQKHLSSLRERFRNAKPEDEGA